MHVIARFSAAASLAALCVTAPAFAQEDVTERDPDAMDVAMTPLSDLNLAKDPIPEILLAARTDPYADEGLTDCMAIQTHIGDLDAVLGDDYDSRPPEERGVSAGGVAQRVVGMFIPFRGIIREISGANAHEYEFREAIGAGMMRRAYLKGLGEARGCPYPARPMTDDLRARLADVEKIAEKGVALRMDRTEAEGETTFESRPVVQGTD